MNIRQKKQSISKFDFVLEAMLNFYLAILTCAGLSSLFMMLIYKYQFVPSSIDVRFIVHPFLGLLSFVFLFFAYFRVLYHFSFPSSKLRYAYRKSYASLQKNSPKTHSYFVTLFKVLLTFNIIIGLSWSSTLTKILSIKDDFPFLHNLFNDKYTSFTDPGMWIWSLIYLIQILIIFFYLKYKYESPKQKPLIDKTMEIYNSPEAEKYRESKYGRYVTVFLLSGFWIFLHQIALILIRVFNQ